MTAIRTVEAHGHVGETVEVRGWLHNVRRLGGVTFVVVRDGWGTIQAVTEDLSLIHISEPTRPY